jgi:phosphohistidine phosphatase
MLSLYLVRHAKSSWADPLQADFQRDLNDRGKRDAPAMAKHFAARRERIDRFVTSPAVRALATAHAVADAFGVKHDALVHEPRLYLASVPTWLEVVAALPEQAHTVAMFGHNPGISGFCEALAEGGLGELPTCAMVRIDLSVNDWRHVARGTGSMVWCDYPKQHAELR